MKALAKPEKPMDDWADRISRRWQEGLEAIIDVGNMLITAKATLPHGEFGKMINSRLPFNSRTAHRLMSISRDVRLSNPEYRPLLPSSWTTLYAITVLSDEEFYEAVEQKIIKPDLERWQIEGFRRKIQHRIAGAEIKTDVPSCFPSPDIRLWTKAQLRRSAWCMQKLLDHVGQASETAVVGECVSDKKLRGFFSE